jgi:hypothetical protein
MRVRLNDLVWVAMGLAAVTASQASAHGAIAIGGNTSEVAAKGIAVGDGYNYDSQADADARALRECEARRAGTAVGPCAIVTSFSHQWLFVSMDPAPGTPGFGWSIDADRDTAQSNALKQCQASSPDNRKQYCVVTQSDQDERP